MLSYLLIRGQPAIVSPKLIFYSILRRTIGLILSIESFRNAMTTVFPMTKTFPHKLHFVMMSIITKFFCFFSLLSITATTLNAQYAVRDCKRVAGDALAINDSLVIVYPGGTFINQGEVYYAGVSRLTNHGGFSELVEGPCSAQYSTSCTAPTGTLGQHVFSSRTGHTLIDGTAPLRMRRVVLNRDITLANTWQISDSLIWQDGLITTNRNVPAHCGGVLERKRRR